MYSTNLHELTCLKSYVDFCRKCQEDPKPGGKIEKSCDDKRLGQQLGKLLVLLEYNCIMKCWNSMYALFDKLSGFSSYGYTFHSCFKCSTEHVYAQRDLCVGLWAHNAQVQLLEHGKSTGEVGVKARVLRIVVEQKPGEDRVPQAVRRIVATYRTHINERNSAAQRAIEQVLEQEHKGVGVSSLYHLDADISPFVCGALTLPRADRLWCRFPFPPSNFEAARAIAIVQRDSYHLQIRELMGPSAAPSVHKASDSSEGEAPQHVITPTQGPPVTPPILASLPLCDISCLILNDPPRSPTADDPTTCWLRVNGRQIQRAPAAST